MHISISGSTQEIAELLQIIDDLPRRSYQPRHDDKQPDSKPVHKEN